MPVTVFLPSVLRGDAAGEPRLTVEASGTIDAVLREIITRWPLLGRRLCDEQGAIRRFVNVYVDGDDVRRISGLSTPVRDGSEIHIIPSVAGG